MIKHDSEPFRSGLNDLRDCNCHLSCEEGQPFQHTDACDFLSSMKQATGRASKELDAWRAEALRDQLAMLAPLGRIDFFATDEEMKDRADAAYRWADAMLRAKTND